MTFLLHKTKPLLLTKSTTEAAGIGEVRQGLAMHSTAERTGWLFSQEGQGGDWTLAPSVSFTFRKFILEILSVG